MGMETPKTVVKQGRGEGNSFNKRVSNGRPKKTYPIDSSSSDSGGDGANSDDLADARREYSALREKVTIVKIPLENSVNGLMLYRLLEFWDRQRLTPMIALSCFHGSLLYGLNVVIQASMVLFLTKIARDLETKLYRETFDRAYGMGLASVTRELRRAVAENNATLSAALNLTNCDGVLEVCATEVEIPYRSIYWVMLFWWFMFMLKELREIRAQFQALWNVERRTDSSYPLCESGGDLVRMDRWMRFTLILLLPIFKVIVAFMLLFAGAKFLMLQTDPFSLVLKALAMQSVVYFDELMVGSLTSRESIESFSKAHIVFTRRSTGNKVTLRFHWKNGVGGLVYFAVTLLVVELFVQVICGDIFQFRAACQRFNEAMNDQYMPPSLGL